MLRRRTSILCWMSLLSAFEAKANNKPKQTKAKQSKREERRGEGIRGSEAMMEGGVNPKKMARSKRASSQRSKAKHSKHHAHGASTGTAAAAAREQRTFAEDSLPSNWERYHGDESGGSDEDLQAALAEGEVRPKSKGAHYRELLSSDVPQLFEESPEMEGMTAILLANGLGLWDWDSSYLEPASLSSERQAAREASALLTVDLRLLGKSLACLTVAQRLLLEDELFPKQNQVEDRIEMVDNSLTRMSDPEDAAAPMKDRVVQEHDDLSQDTSVTSGNTQVNAESPSSALASETSSFNRHGSNYGGDCVSSVGTDTSRLGSTGTKSPSVNTGDLVLNSAPTVSSVWEHNIEMQMQKGVVITKEVTEVKRFEAAAAEAELDDLLDMLDHQVASISLRKDSQVNLPRSVISENRPFSPSYPASSRPSNSGFQESRVETRPWEVTPEFRLGATPKYAGPPAESAKQWEKNDSSSHAKADDVVLSQEMILIRGLIQSKFLL